MTAIETSVAVTAALNTRLRHNLFIRGVLSSRRGIIGLLGVSLLIALTLLGPLFSPYSPTAVVGLPLKGPSTHHLLGTDELGRDAFSRFLYGGRYLLGGTFLSSGIAYLLGIFVGMAAGYRRGRFELTVVGGVDLIIAFPPLVLMLLLLAGAGTGFLIATVAVAAIQFPRIVRIVRTATLEVSTQEFVEAAEARGESNSTILVREILPNIWSPILADFGIRLASSALLLASLSYLGLGPAPPTADWGLMISENRDAIIIQPWIIVAPALAIGFLTVMVNLAADSVARSVGRSLVARDV